MYLRGLFDSEGCAPTDKNSCIKFTNSDKFLIDQVATLLNEFGIYIAITYDDQNLYGEVHGKKFKRKPYYNILISGFNNKKKYADQIGFSIKRKQHNLDYLKGNPPWNSSKDFNTVQNIHMLRKKGLTYRAIAENLKIGYGTVHRYLNLVNKNDMHRDDGNSGSIEPLLRKI